MILTVSNNHTASCGEPPALGDIHDHRYVSYFENAYREQWVFWVDAQGVPMLRGGDIQWTSKPAMAVVAGRLMVSDGEGGFLLMNAPERAWLEACWEASKPWQPWQ